MQIVFLLYNLSSYHTICLLILQFVFLSYNLSSYHTICLLIIQFVFLFYNLSSYHTICLLIIQFVFLSYNLSSYHTICLLILQFVFLSCNLITFSSMTHVYFPPSALLFYYAHILPYYEHCLLQTLSSIIQVSWLFNGLPMQKAGAESLRIAVKEFHLPKEILLSIRHAPPPALFQSPAYLKLLLISRLIFGHSNRELASSRGSGLPLQGRRFLY